VELPKIPLDLSTKGMKTDAGSLEIEEQAIKIDELNTAQFRELRAKAEKQQFQVNRFLYNPKCKMRTFQL